MGPCLCNFLLPLQSDCKSNKFCDYYKLFIIFSKMIIPQTTQFLISDAEFAATVGFFDGVHLGHRFLIDELNANAQKHGLKSMVITFKNHPQTILNKEFRPQLLTTNTEKVEYLYQLGVDEVVELDFTREIADLSAAQFVKNVLFYDLHVRFLLVGHDHRFGKDRKDGFPEYQLYGQEVGMLVQQASLFSTEKFDTISSTDIRGALDQADIDAVNELLGRPYSFVGQVIDGFKVGRKIGFPTANLKPIDDSKIIPPIGVYAVEIAWNGNAFKAMMNIGRRPTVDNSSAISLEVHIIDFDEDIYHQQLKVSFLKKIRDEKKFNSVEELIAQLKLDKAFVMSNI